MSKAPTQKELILKYLHDFGSITPMQAFSDLGITKLSTRVSEMRSDDGIEFKIESVKIKNRYGKTVHFSRYSLEEKAND